MPGKRWISEEKRRKIAEDYVRLQSYRAVAAKNQVAPNTVKNILREGTSPSGEAAFPENTRTGDTCRETEQIEGSLSSGARESVSGKETGSAARERERETAPEEELVEEEEIRRLLRLLLRRMGDPQAVLELNAYQAARVYAMLCTRITGEEDRKTVRVSFGAVNGEDLSLLAR